MADLGSFKSVGPISEEGVSNVTATPSVALGTRRTHMGEDYVYFYNNGASAASVGLLLTSTGLSGYSLTKSTVSGNDFPLCVVKHAEVPAGSYGWGLVRGICTPQVESTMATGTLLMVADAGLFKTLLTGSTSFPVGPIGKMLATNTNTTGIAYVKLYG